jgi:hypothetical protein
MDYISLTKSIVIDGNSTYTSVFNEYPIYVFYLAWAVPTFITFLLVVFSCLSKTQWEGGDPRVDKMKKNKYGLFSICWATCTLHHILVSAFCGREKSNVHLTLPKSSKMIDFWWLFYAILAGIGLTLW